MYEISKDFSFAYGHRVHTQSVNSEYTENHDTRCACRHLHGHEGTVTVHLSAEKTDMRGMLVDFKELGWLKNFIDDTIDHKFIIDYNDPMFIALVTDMLLAKPANLFKPVNVPGTDVTVGRIVDLSILTPGTPVYDVIEGYFIIDFVPTSENLAKWMFDLVSIKMKPFNVTVSEVSWRETPKSIARYRG